MIDKLRMVIGTRMTWNAWFLKCQTPSFFQQVRDSHSNLTVIYDRFMQDSHHRYLLDTLFSVVAGWCSCAVSRIKDYLKVSCLKVILPCINPSLAAVLRLKLENVRSELGWRVSLSMKGPGWSLIQDKRMTDPWYSEWITEAFPTCLIEALKTDSGWLRITMDGIRESESGWYSVASLPPWVVFRQRSVWIL